MNIEVVYAGKDKQKLYLVECEKVITVKAAIIQSGVLKDFPEIDLNEQPVGVFAQIVELDHALKEGDRVEIYRPLIIDPKDARRIRAEEKRKKNGLKLFGA